MTARPIARILLDSPLPQLDRLFDYAIPESLLESARPGVRVRVPLRSAGRMIDGFIVETGRADDAECPLSDIEEVVSTVQVLPPHLYALARRTADRAAGGAADILRLVIPKRQVRVEKAWLAADPPDAPDAALSVSAADALDGFPGLADAVTAGARRAVIAPPSPISLEDGTPVGGWAPLMAAACAAVLAQGRSAILVVPDHRDYDQAHAALRALVPDDALVQDDARRSNPDRYRGFLRTLADAPCIVLGKRSAVYAPVRDLGLIALWDDSDPLLAEPLAPYVHARDAALIRQELTGCALLFGAHTRSSDVQRLIEIGWVAEVEPARRRTPRVVLSGSDEREAHHARVTSAAFRAAQESVREGAVLVQVARPGYSPVLVCAQCRTPARCRHCAGPLQASAPRATPVCGWCGRSAHRWACTACEATTVRLASSGSERTADELGRAFPGVRVLVSDRDHPLLQIEDRPSLVIATRGAEPIVPGGYRAVVLLDGERMLMAESLRIGESCLRWWSNAAALAAPGAPVHLVGVDGPVARAFATGTFAAYARAELADRGPLRMPPAVRVAEITGTAEGVDAARTALAEAEPALPADAVLGPLPDPDDPARRRALVRFDYARGPAVAAALRGAVIAQAMRGRRRPRGAPTNTLRVRMDVPDIDL